MTLTHPSPAAGAPQAPTGAYVYLLAAGAVSLDRWLHERPARLRRLLVATAITTVASALTVLPVLPPADIGWDLQRQHGQWRDDRLALAGRHRLVGTVRTVWTSLPPRQLANAVIFTENYSEVGAINELGGELALRPPSAATTPTGGGNPVTRTPRP